MRLLLAAGVLVAHFLEISKSLVKLKGQILIERTNTKQVKKLELMTLSCLMGIKKHCSILVDKLPS